MSSEVSDLQHRLNESSSQVATLRGTCRSLQDSVSVLEQQLAAVKADAEVRVAAERRKHEAAARGVLSDLYDLALKLGASQSQPSSVSLPAAISTLQEAIDTRDRLLAAASETSAAAARRAEAAERRWQDSESRCSRLREEVRRMQVLLSDAEAHRERAASLSRISTNLHLETVRADTAEERSQALADELKSTREALADAQVASASSQSLQRELAELRRQVVVAQDAARRARHDARSEAQAAASQDSSRLRTAAESAHSAQAQLVALEAEVASVRRTLRASLLTLDTSPASPGGALTLTALAQCLSVAVTRAASGHQREQRARGELTACERRAETAEAALKEARVQICRLESRAAAAQRKADQLLQTQDLALKAVGDLVADSPLASQGNRPPPSYRAHSFVPAATASVVGRSPPISSGSAQQQFRRLMYAAERDLPLPGAHPSSRGGSWSRLVMK
jgi:predicted  nucleic acid-binding Zn-ribbon protein